MCGHAPAAIDRMAVADLVLMAQQLVHAGRLQPFPTFRGDVPTAGQAAPEVL